METTITESWDRDDSDLQETLDEVDGLYRAWSTKYMAPFNPYSDPTFLRTAATARKAGLPWFSNGIAVPQDRVDNWPFHFKELELDVLNTKGRRVGDSAPGGYVCSRREANQFLIHTLVQQAQKHHPEAVPLLVAAPAAHDDAQAAAEMCGLECVQLRGNPDGTFCASELEQVVQSRKNKACSMIVAANLGNDWGCFDDIFAIQEFLATYRPQCTLACTHLHVDASRTFDYLTTLSEADRAELGIPRLLLRSEPPDQDAFPGVVHASTIVAGGLNFSNPPFVVAMKAHSTCECSDRYVEYVQSRDSTLSGSRDALNAVLVALQEQRFGETGLQLIYKNCRTIRQMLSNHLRASGVPVDMPPFSLDMIIHTSQPLTEAHQKKWGLVRLRPRTYLMTAQPSVTVQRAHQFLKEVFGICMMRDSHLSMVDIDPSTHKVPEGTAGWLSQKVEQWQVLSRRSVGFPGNQATLSALGPILGRMMTREIPTDWAQEQMTNLLNDLRQRFKVAPDLSSSFSGGITTGGTEGNRVGILTALKHCRHGHIYMSTATHYSVRKILETRFSHNKDDYPRYSEVEADDLGRMVPQAFVQRVQRDKQGAYGRGQPHQVVLVANFGTTFTGGADDVVALRQSLDDVGLEIDYIHADGALSFGYDTHSVSLGPPKSGDNSTPVVQSIAVSNQKFAGLSVSGLVLCYSPNDGDLVGLDTRTNSRIVFELWLYKKLFRPAAINSLFEECMTKARLLRKWLQDAGVVTQYNPQSPITLVERQPRWLIEAFNLSPEGNWVHFVNMPHVSVETCRLFASTVVAHRRQFERALSSPTETRNVGNGEAQNLPRLKRIACWESNLIEKYRNLLPDELIPEFIPRWVQSTMSFAAIDGAGDPYAVFLVDVPHRHILKLDKVVVKDKTVLPPLLEIGLQVIKRMCPKSTFGSHEPRNFESYL